MKKQDILKTVKLVIYIILAAVSIYFVLFDKEIFHAIGVDRSVRTAVSLVWLNLAVSFAIMLTELNFFNSMKKDYSELDYAVHTDTLSGLGNRFGADSIIETYLDKPIPPDFCCAMIDLTNLREVNELQGHLAGNTLIKEFSQILTAAAKGKCYVARNGGNKFIAIFDSATPEDIREFGESLHNGITKHNAIPGTQVIRYRTGIAYHEPESASIRGVTDLISLANRRIYEDSTV